MHCMCLCALQGTGVGDSISYSPSTELLPGEGPSSASVVNKRFEELGADIHEIRQDISEVKEAQTRMEQELLTAISNVDAQLHCIMQSLPPAQQQRPSKLDSSGSVYYTAPSSRINSNDMDGIARFHTQPPSTLLLQMDSKQLPMDHPMSPTLMECKLDHVPKENTDLELHTQVRQHSMHAPPTAYTLLSL